MIHELSTLDLAQALREKKFSCQEAVSFFLDRISKFNPHLNAVISLNEKALDQAKKLDQKGFSGKPLEGVPILFKDMFCTKNIKTTAGSKILHNFIPPYSAEAADRLVQAGAIVLGKCNQDEFAMGNSNETSIFGAVKNPWNFSHVPGGSSGGSACAVSAGFASASLGTDTGGSIRQPSHFCNIVGVKPTYGRVSRYGIIAYASSLDQAGPMARKVEDCALILHLISGKDPKDMTTSSQQIPLWHKQLKASRIKDLKIGWLEIENLSPPVQKSMNQTKKALKNIKTIQLPLLKYCVSVYYLISTSEASSNLARYDGIRYGLKSDESELIQLYQNARGKGFGKEVKRRILMGTFCLSQGYFSAYFEKAQKVRRLIQEEFQNIFKEVDVLVSPVTETLPPRIGERAQGSAQYYTSDSLTVAGNLAGLPSLSVPVGIFDGFPLGAQIIGPAFEEQKILDTAYFLQEEFQSYKNKPPLKENP